MTSLLCVRHLGGNVQVHDKDAVENIVDTADNRHLTLYSAMVDRSNAKSKSPSFGSRRSSSSKSRCRSQNGMDSSNLLSHTMKIHDWLNEKTIKDLQEKADVETRSVRKLYNPLLETESTFVKDLELFLNYKSMLDLRKKEMLHKNWNERVYEPLRSKIVEAMEGHAFSDVDRRKREMHKQYLEFVNRKGHVFLETIDSQIYNAQALNGYRPCPLVVQTEPLRDPLKSQSRNKAEEERTILRCTTGIRYSDDDIKQVQFPPLPMVPLGRHGTDSKKWLEMPLENIESSSRKYSQKRMKPERNASKLDYDVWSKIPSDERTAELELALQKKRMFKEKPPFGIRPLTPAHMKDTKPCKISQDSPETE